jgi:hypothetical protein
LRYDPTATQLPGEAQLVDFRNTSPPARGFLGRTAFDALHLPFRSLRSQP